MEIDPVGGDEGAFPPAGARRAGGAEGVARRALDAGVLRDVPQAGDHREPRRHGQQPQDEEGPPGAEQAEQDQQSEVEQQEGGDRAAGDHRVPGEVLVAARLECLQRKQDPLLEEGLAGQVADDLAAQGGAAHRKRGGEDEVGVFRLLGVFVVGEMVGAIELQRGPDGRGAQPVAEDVVEPGVRRETAVRGLMHQDRQAQLARADDGDGDRDQPRPEHPGGDGQGDHRPAVGVQQRADPGGARLEGRPGFGREQVGGSGAGRGGHGDRIRPRRQQRKHVRQA